MSEADLAGLGGRVVSPTQAATDTASAESTKARTPDRRRRMVRRRWVWRRAISEFRCSRVGPKTPNLSLLVGPLMSTPKLSAD
ncbi:MAG: hypothetical protein ACRDRT_13400 [Pseudonocardiaceae bacterium]